MLPTLLSLGSHRRRASLSDPKSPQYSWNSSEYTRINPRIYLNLTTDGLGRLRTTCAVARRAAPCAGCAEAALLANRLPLDELHSLLVLLVALIPGGEGPGQLLQLLQRVEIPLKVVFRARGPHRRDNNPIFIYDGFLSIFKYMLVRDMLKYLRVYHIGIT